MKLRQREHVQRGPHQPGDKAAAAEITRLKDGEILTHYRHTASVAVPKRLTILASSDAVGNDMPDKSSLLNGCLRHSGHGLTILEYSGCVARHKHIGRIGDVHESTNECAPTAVRLRPQHFYDGRGADACCPKHSGAPNAGASCDYALFVDLLDLYTRRNLNAEFR